MAAIIIGSLGKAAFGQIGGLVGALAGTQIDNILLSNLSANNNQNSKLGNLKIQTSQNGAPIPKIFGRARLSGQIIWADDFKETTIKRTIGGKGGKKTKDFIYSISFAIGLCEGEIARIGRVWANGEIIDLNQFEYRFYNGKNEAPDPLLEAKLGIDNCPQYNNLAYIVFEDMPLEKFGDRIPQLSFELFAKNKNDNSIENLINGVCLIPASGEFAYSTTPIIEKIGHGNEVFINNHQDEIKTDFVCAIENLENELQNSKSISLVVSWFGTNINAQECQIVPKVENNSRITSPRNWKVAGLNRQNAQKVSQYNGTNSYGGTIDDISVIEAINHLNSKGFSVCFNPFIMMDCDGFPWRGRISLSENLKGTNSIIAPIDNFYGNVKASHFSISNNQINYNGPNEWSYSRFILHYANLCKLAGGVESFLIGSELIGLTRLYDENNNFYFVDKLVELAHEVRLILGNNTKISYAADWTEYGAYYVESGNNTFFPCDKLWANDNIDFIGIDFYAPLSDVDSGDIPNIDDLQKNIEGFENFDYFYQSEEARFNRLKTPIIDEIYNEEWVYRQKDLRGFWSNFHFNRINGIKALNHNSWIPQSKPIRLMEIGFPAIDMAANRPSVFPDEKSIENGVPPFSNNMRDDAQMRNSIFALLDYWQGENNPISNLYGQNMIDKNKIHIWAWDARPYPYFPNLSNVWSDGQNYEKGHWLMGRVNLANLNSIFEYCLKSLKINNYILENIDIPLDGFIIEQNEKPIEIIEFFMLAFDIKYKFENGKLVFFKQNYKNENYIDFEDLFLNQEGEIIIRNFNNEVLPSGISFKFYAQNMDYEIYELQSGDMKNSINLNAPLVGNPKQIENICDNILKAQSKNLETINISLGLDKLFDLKIGDIIVFANGEKFIIQNIEIGESLILSLTKLENLDKIQSNLSVPNNFETPKYFEKPMVFVLDLPSGFFNGESFGPKIFAASENFNANTSLWFGDEPIAEIKKCAKIGYLLEAYEASSIAFISKNKMKVQMRFGKKLPNSGFAAIYENGEIKEIFEFKNAILIDENLYELNEIIRGLNGIGKSEKLNQNADFILLDDAGELINLPRDYWKNNIICELKSPSNRQNSSYQVSINYGASYQKPWSISHIKATRKNSLITINFHTRDKNIQNSWELYRNKSEEKFEINILDANDNVKRQIITSENSIEYSNEFDDFGTIQNHLNLEICAINEFGEKGYFAKQYVEL